MDEQMECKRKANSEGCVCTSEDCERRGICCDCLKRHVGKKSLPACLRKLDWLQVVKDESDGT